MEQADKDQALAEYKAAKAAYLDNPTDESWRAFCDCKRVCRLLGVII